MFLGHFAIGFAAKTVSPQVSLGTFVFASLFVDLLWSTFLLIGLEQVLIAPGITSVTALDFTYHPISHSFASVIGWGLLIAGGYWLWRRSLWGAAVVGGVGVSHWILDLVVHRADLPLYPGSLFPNAPGSMKHMGFGLWHSLPATVLVEGLLFAGGLYLYVSMVGTAGRLGQYGFWALVAVLIGSYVVMLVAAPPPSVAVVAWAGQLQWLLVGWAYWIGDRREAAFAWTLNRFSADVGKSYDDGVVGLSGDTNGHPLVKSDGTG